MMLFSDSFSNILIIFVCRTETERVFRQVAVLGNVGRGGSGKLW